MEERMEYDRKIRPPFEGIFFQFPRRSFRQLDTDMGIRFVQQWKYGGQNGGAAVIGAADAYGAAYGLLQVLDTAVPFAVDFPYFFFCCEINPPCFCQDDTTSAAFEQRCPICFSILRINWLSEG